MKVGKVFYHFQSSEVFLQHKTGSFIELVKRKPEVVSKILTNHIDDEEEHGKPKLLILIIYIIVSMRAEVGAIQSSRKLSQNFPFTHSPSHTCQRSFHVSLIF